MRRLVPSLSLAMLLLYPPVAPANAGGGRQLAGADSIPAWAQPLMGSWACDGAFASGKLIAADVQIQSSLGGRWLQYHHKDRAPGRYEVSALWGPLTPGSQLAATILYDNFGGSRRFGLIPTATGLILERDTTESNAQRERFVFRPREDKSLWFAWELYHNSAWTLGDSLSCRRSTP